ncbi:hypothetical protein [Xanthomonas cannabis]|uniref:hypothetical protein n=1 Tax=Xanthomonas cannabis TaxID=1885674 RepID=UPI00141B821B|nr:hypothetical protein [Xanthomonas cannabis]NIK17387.1 hypothetical protein [Xanthomonas cannabis]
MSATVLPFPPARVIRRTPRPSPSRVDALVAALERLAADPNSPFARRIQELRKGDNKR